jgi:hypothetical protein
MLNQNNPILASATAPIPLSRLASEINAAHYKVLYSVRATLEHACRAGELLVVAKERVGHGHWHGWVRQNCGFSPRTATNYDNLRATGRTL